MATQEEVLKLTLAGDSSSYEASINRANVANGNLLNGQKKVRKALVGFAQDFSNAGSASDIFTSAITRASAAFKVGFASFAAVGVGQALATGIKHAAEETDKLSEALEEVGSFDMRDESKTVSQLTEEIKKTTKAFSDLQEAEKKIGLFQKTLTYFKTGENFGEQERLNKKAEDELTDEIRHKTEALVDLERQRTYAAQLTAQGYDEQAEKLNKQIQRAQELHKVEKDEGFLAAQAVKERFAAEDAAEQRKKQFQDLELERNKAILSAERIGADVEIEKAKAVVAYREKVLELTNDPRQRQAAAYELDAAYQALDTAKKRKEVEREIADLRIESAKVIGDEDRKRWVELQREGKRLQDLVDSTTGDALPGLQAQLAENMQAQLAALNEMQANVFGRMRNEVVSNQGNGPEAEIAAQQELLNLKKQEYAVDSKTEDFDSNKLSSLQAEIATGERSLSQKKAEYEIKQLEIRLEAETNAINETNLSSEAKKYKILQEQINTLETEAEIQRDLNSEVAEEYRLRAENLRNEQRLMDQQLNYGKSTLEIDRRLRQERTDARKRDEFDAKRKSTEGLINVHRDMGGAIISGTNPVTGEKEQRHPADPLDPNNRRPHINTKPHLQDDFDKQRKEFEKKFKPHNPDDDWNPVDQAKAKPMSENEKIVAAIVDLKTSLISALIK